MNYFVHLKLEGSVYYPVQYDEDVSQSLPAKVSDIVTGSISIEPFDAILRYATYTGTETDGATDGVIDTKYYLLVSTGGKVLGMRHAYDYGVLQSAPATSEIEEATSVTGAIAYTAENREGTELSYNSGDDSIAESARKTKLEAIELKTDLIKRSGWVYKPNPGDYVNAYIYDFDDKTESKIAGMYSVVDAVGFDFSGDKVRARTGVYTMGDDTDCKALYENFVTTKNTIDQAEADLIESVLAAADTQAAMDAITDTRTHPQQTEIDALL